MPEIIDLSTPGLNKRQRDFLIPLSLIPSFDFSQDWVQSEVISLKSPESSRQKVKAEQYETKLREAEGVLLSLHYPKGMEEHTCKACKRKFGTNYVYNKHCSEECLKDSLAVMGLSWNPEKPWAERWGAEPPLVVSPETWSKLKAFAERILQHEPVLRESELLSSSSPTDSIDTESGRVTETDEEYVGSGYPNRDIGTDPESTRVITKDYSDLFTL